MIELAAFFLGFAVCALIVLAGLPTAIRQAYRKEKEQGK